MKGWKQIFQTNGQEKKAGVAILISEKTEFKRRAIKRDPEGHFIINTQRKNPPRRHKCFKYITTNIGASKYIEKILLAFKKDIDINTIIVGDFNTPLSKMDRSSKQTLNKDILTLKNTLDEVDLTDM